MTTLPGGGGQVNRHDEEKSADPCEETHYNHTNSKQPNYGMPLSIYQTNLRRPTAILTTTEPSTHFNLPLTTLHTHPPITQTTTHTTLHSLHQTLLTPGVSHKGSRRSPSNHKNTVAPFTRDAGMSLDIQQHLLSAPSSPSVTGTDIRAPRKQVHFANSYR
jgi:hypothetical protein